MRAREYLIPFALGTLLSRTCWGCCFVEGGYRLGAVQA